jgi:hypothetical protein
MNFNSLGVGYPTKTAFESLSCDVQDYSGLRSHKPRGFLARFIGGVKKSLRCAANPWSGQEM